MINKLARLVLDRATEEELIKYCDTHISSNNHVKLLYNTLEDVIFNQDLPEDYEDVLLCVMDYLWRHND